MPNNDMFTNVPGANNDGVNAGVKIDNIDILKDTDIGLLRNRSTKDKSTYKRTTKPDGTIIEEVKMDKKNTNKGLLDLGTQGINIGDIGVKAGVGEKSLEDAVSFVDSIWGGRKAADATQQKRLEEMKLEKFKQARQEQFAQDSLIRKMNTENLLEETNVRGLR